MLDDFLSDAVILMGVAVAALFVGNRLRLPPLVGLLLTGMLIGPSGLRLISNVEEVEMFAEIGVVLLLFIIGLEISVERLKELRRPFLLGGAIQAALTTLLAGGFAAAFGLELRRALFLGFVFTLSSTAIVLKIYNERRQTESPHGQLSLAILLFQDFLIVPMIVLTPVLGGTVPASAGELALRFGGALLAIGLIVLVARWVMPRVLPLLVATGIRELFVMMALGLCLAMSWVTHAFGFSLALGAFLAGILLSETEYSHQAIADMSPFRDVFASLFFISIGMLVDLRLAAASLLWILVLAVAIVLLKSLTALAAVRFLGFPGRTAILTALGLAQIGEFSFVLMDVGLDHGLLQGGRFQLILAASVLTMLVTPGLFHLAPKMADIWRSWKGAPIDEDAPEARRDHVILVGYGVGGHLLARVLSEVRVPFVAIELNSETVRAGRREGTPVVYGDVTRREILEHAGIADAKMVVFAISDPEALASGVHLARELGPSATILVRTRRLHEIDELRKLGADHVVAEEFETAIELFTRVLDRYHVPRHVVRAQTRTLRGESYRMLRSEVLSEGVSNEVLAALAASATDIFQIGEESPAVGRTLRDLDLRKRTGATVVAVVRGDLPFTNPDGDLALESGDCLVLVGGHGEVDAAFAELSEGTADVEVSGS